MANRFYLNDLQFSRTENCVFISHHKNDKEIAKKIAEYIYASGVDIYFDEFDNSINKDNPDSVVNAIKRGINRSSHMLCILSKDALRSKWMPWEIGYGYDRLLVAGVIIKGLSYSVLPEYLQIVPIIQGTNTLNAYISDLANRDESSLIREAKLISASKLYHPLNKLLNRKL